MEDHWIHPTRLNGKVNPAWYAEYYARHGERIRARNRTRNKATSRRGLSNMDYKRMLMAILFQRDGGKCGICGKPVIEIKQASVDHIVQRAIGGTDAATNLRLAHRKCNVHREKPSLVRGKKNV